MVKESETVPARDVEVRKDIIVRISIVGATGVLGCVTLERIYVQRDYSLTRAHI